MRSNNIHLPIYLFMYIVHLSTNLLSFLICIYLANYPSTRLSILLTIYQSIKISNYLSIYLPITTRISFCFYHFLASPLKGMRKGILWIKIKIPSIQHKDFISWFKQKYQHFCHGKKKQMYTIRPDKFERLFCTENLFFNFRCSSDLTSWIKAKNPLMFLDLNKYQSKTHTKPNITLKYIFLYQERKSRKETKYKKGDKLRER